MKKFFGSQTLIFIIEIFLAIIGLIITIGTNNPIRLSIGIFLIIASMLAAFCRLPISD